MCADIDLEADTELDDLDAPTEDLELELDVPIIEDEDDDVEEHTEVPPEDTIEDPLGLDDIEKLAVDLPAHEEVYTTDITTRYLNEAARAPLLTAQQEIELSTAALAGSIEARDKLVAANLRLVASLCRRWSGTGEPLLDLIQEGNLGLLKAVDKFNPALGYKFSTYAYWWINQSIAKSYERKGRIVQVPVHILRGIAKCMREMRANKLNPNLTRDLETLASITGYSIKQIRTFLRYKQSTLSLSESEAFEDTSRVKVSLLDTIDEVESAEATASTNEDKHKLWKLVDLLPKRDRDIIARRYGLGNYEPHTLQEISEIYSITRERVRQVETKAMTALRYHASIQHLR